MVKIMSKPENPIKIHDLGVPLFFGNTHIVFFIMFHLYQLKLISAKQTFQVTPNIYQVIQAVTQLDPRSGRRSPRTNHFERSRKLTIPKRSRFRRIERSRFLQDFGITPVRDFSRDPQARGTPGTPVRGTHTIPILQGILDWEWYRSMGLGGPRCLGVFLEFPLRKRHLKSFTV